MCNCQIYALRVELVGFLGAKISSMCLATSLPVNTARHVIAFDTRQLKASKESGNLQRYDEQSFVANRNLLRVILLSVLMSARRPDRKRTNSTKSSIARKLLD